MISLPLQPKIKEQKENSAIFEIEGLEPGYGVTIGNSLRRVLLSSLSGAAATMVKIKGVQHEFSTIPGVAEDTLNIMLNLKKLRFKLYSDEPQKAVVSVKGEKEITGADFKYSSQVELINKDAHIATLTDKKAELELEIQIEKGRGYEPVERRKKQAKLEVGAILLDATFTPIRRVSFEVENMRVDERTDFDRLTLKIETDGTVEPGEAFYQAAEVLVKHFEIIAAPFKKAEEEQPVKKEEEAKEEKEEKKEKKEKTKVSGKKKKTKK